MVRAVLAAVILAGAPALAWITIASGQQTGPGQLSYTIAANTGASRSVTLTIAGQSVLVSQGANTIPAPPTTLRVVRSGSQ